jgi:hypothetical protein
MLHAGLALELSRTMWEDRRAEAARARRRPSGTGRGARPGRGPVIQRAVLTRLTHREDPWQAWRVIDPDPEYLRRRAA